MGSPDFLKYKNRRYLTKTRFSLALECPTKLVFEADKSYANRTECDEFLRALAEMGHHVGALAKTLLGAGIEVVETDHDAAVLHTKKLLQEDNVLIFEAAFCWENCYVRVDLLRKSGNVIDIFEVKAKSFDPVKGASQIVGKTNNLLSDFRSYVQDVAFQRCVVRNCCPEFEVSCSLVFVNKLAVSTVETFRYLRTERSLGRTSVSLGAELQDGQSAAQLLVIVPADAFANIVEKSPLIAAGYKFESFETGIADLQRRVNEQPYPPLLGSHCKNCQFVATSQQLKDGLLDGRSLCWSSLGLVTGNSRATILELHGGSAKLIDKLLVEKKFVISDVMENDLDIKLEDNKITLSQRNWFQCLEARGEIDRPKFVKSDLRLFLDSLKYPIHFIDFETARPPLPFHNGRRPYEHVLFQFSHHIVDVNGVVAHVSQYLESDVGLFPNFVVLSKLRDALASDNGSVLHWWEHERTVLNDVKKQIELAGSALPFRAELIDFVVSLIGVEKQGGRLVDLGRFMERNVFVPGTSGSSSIKKVLPALLRFSPELEAIYSSPIYGSDHGIRSSNFTNHSWFVRGESGEVCDPYSLLGERFDDASLAGADLLEEVTVIADGGAAMIAYGLLQDDMLSQTERGRLQQQLLRYCELDTLAMVMVWQALQSMAA